MSHPFGDLVSQHLHRKHGLSQSKLAEGILQAPTVVSAMCKGRRLVGPQARERVVAIITWLHRHGALDTLDEANALLNAAGMAGLTEREISGANLRGLAEARAGSHTPTRPQHRHNLPAPATSLIGRDGDVTEVKHVLTGGQTGSSGLVPARLVTLVGPPGVGKTRLALQVAWEMQDVFADGAWFVPLAGVDDPRHIAATVIQALGLPDASLAPEPLLKHFLRDKRLLLVLDNFEQLLGSAEHESNDLAGTPKSAGASTVGLVAELVAGSPGLKVLTTSRAALQLTSEHLFEVRPLTEPTAVELFVQRARAVNYSFALAADNAQAVTEICRRLDGLPLAIELAAARIRMFDPVQLLARLSSRLDVLTSRAQDLPARQRTLRGTIEWSYTLLSPEEQTLFRRLGVFAGGCSMEAAERVAGEGLPTPVLDLVQSLADKSLIKIDAQGGETRCTMLETLREYTLGQLKASGEMEAMTRQHAEYFVEYAESVEPKLHSSEESIWLRRLDRDGDNLQAALAHARRVDDTQLLIRFIAALWWWWRRVPDAEGWSWAPALLAHPRVQQSKLIRAKGLYASARILFDGIGNWSRAQIMLEESARLCDELGEILLLAKSLATLGELAWGQGEYPKARDYCAQSRKLFIQAGDNLGAANSLIWQAAAVRDQGGYERAAQLLEQSLLQLHDLNVRWSEGMALNGMGDLAFDRGDYAEAQICYEKARKLWREIDVLIDLPFRGLGRIAYVHGDLTHADSLLETVVTNARKWMNTTILQWSLHHYGFTKHLVGDPANAMALLREGIMMQHRQLHRLCIAESLERFAWVAADTHQPHRAAKLFGAANALRQWMGAPLPLGDKPLYDHYLEMTRAALDSDDFGQAWVEGAAMSLDQAVAYALADEHNE